MLPADAQVVADSYQRLESEHPGRFVLGVGIGHLDLPRLASQQGGALEAQRQSVGATEEEAGREHAHRMRAPARRLPTTTAPSSA